MAPTLQQQRYLLLLSLSSPHGYLLLGAAPKAPSLHRGTKHPLAVLQLSTKLFFLFLQNFLKSNLIHSALHV